MLFFNITNDKIIWKYQTKIWKGHLLDIAILDENF